MQTTFYIVRHGQSEGNKQGIIQGHLDFPLTEEGKEQAKVLSNHLKEVEITAIYSSDLQRAKQTAEIIARNKKMPVQSSPALRERYLGELQGKPGLVYSPELKKLFAGWSAMPLNKWLSHRIVESMENGHELISRITNFLNSIVSRYQGQTVLIVSHGNVMRTLLVYLNYATPQILKNRSIQNTAYIKLLYKQKQLRVEQTYNIDLFH